MVRTFHAIFENGVLRPVEPVELPDHCAVEIEVRTVQQPSDAHRLEEVYRILQRRFSSGETDVAGRHDEHQP